MEFSWRSPLNAGDAACHQVDAQSGADATRKADQDLFSEYLPADGTNAAVNWRDYGRSRWQLSDKITTIAGVHVRGRSTYFAAREAAIGPSRNPRPPAVAAAFWGSAGIALTTG